MFSLFKCTTKLEYNLLMRSHELGAQAENTMNYVGHQLQNNFQQGVGNDGWLPPQAPSLNHEVETVC